MAMRDPKEMAREWMARVTDPRYSIPVDGYTDELVTLPREAQEDGARGATCPHCGPDTDLNAALNQVAAITERAERAEAEAQQWHEVLCETSSKLDDTEHERDEAVEALDAHKERADRAESELHRRKF